MLTILGYSINATIVIFDRIREELRVMKRNDDLKALVNRSITYTLTRSIYTTFYYICHGSGSLYHGCKLY